MRGALFALLILLAPSVVWAQETDDIGIVETSFSVVLQNGNTLNNGDGVAFVPNKSQCEVQVREQIRVGGRTPEGGRILHYRVKNNKEQRGKACPDTVMFRVTAEEFRQLPVRWKKPGGPDRPIF